MIMKRLFLTLAIMFTAATYCCAAETTITGEVWNANGRPLAGAVMILHGASAGDRIITSDGKGESSDEIPA
jgi:hypothetical protein